MAYNLKVKKIQEQAVLTKMLLHLKTNLTLLQLLDKNQQMGKKYLLLWLTKNKQMGRKHLLLLQSRNQQMPRKQPLQLLLKRNNNQISIFNY